MLITLDYRSRLPLCEQLCDSITRLGACGAIAPGEQLPSVRALAQELGVNPNTVQKAYRILEARGVLETVPGKGSFLSHSGDANALMKRQGQEQLRSGLQTALDSGMSEAEILAFCTDYLNQKEGLKK